MSIGEAGPATLQRSADPHPPRFVVQKHWSRRVHYDFRLQVGERLVSWAIPKGPSLDPRARRMAIRMPDHPLDQDTFEGVIPAPQYGAGVVMIWDAGEYEPLLPARLGPEAWLERGYLKFILHGSKLRGLWELVRYPRGPRRSEAWLLVKIRDRHAQRPYDPEDQPLSVLSGWDRGEIAEAGGQRRLADYPLDA